MILLGDRTVFVGLSLAVGAQSEGAYVYGSVHVDRLAEVASSPSTIGRLKSGRRDRNNKLTAIYSKGGVFHIPPTR